MTRNELYHHGIKGQKWGIRRYQNEDGSYTAAGKKRYLADNTKKIQRDIDSFKGHENGIYDKNGRQVLSKEDVSASVKGLERQKALREKNLSNKWDQQVKNQEWKALRKDHIKNESSTGHQVANFLINGPFGAYTYNSMRTAGYSRLQSEAASIASRMIAGPLGNMAVSAVISSSQKRKM